MNNELSKEDYAVFELYNGQDCSNTIETAIELTLNHLIVGTISCSKGEMWYKFTPRETKWYSIYTTGSLDTEGYLYDSNGTLIENNHDWGEGLNFRIERQLAEGETYYIKINCYNNRIGNFHIRVSDNILIKEMNVIEPYACLRIGDSLELIANVLPSYASNKSVVWKSCNLYVAGVNASSGIITARGEGVSYICAYSQDGSQEYGYCELYVRGMWDITKTMSDYSICQHDQNAVFPTSETENIENLDNSNPFKSHYFVKNIANKNNAVFTIDNNGCAVCCVAAYMLYKVRQHTDWFDNKYEAVKQALINTTLSSGAFYDFPTFRYSINDTASTVACIGTPWGISGIEQSLSQGCCCIAQVLNPTNHYVLVYGKNGIGTGLDNYLVMDPTDGTTKTLNEVFPANQGNKTNRIKQIYIIK